MAAPEPGSPRQRAIDHVTARSTGGPIDPDLRVTLNFHPDRLVNGEPILHMLAREGTYRSQFETGTSNGGLTAHPGGERWLWEKRMFGGAYDETDAGERPKYGALDLRRQPVGAAPRFGSSYFRLRREVLGRATFCFPDSVFEPKHFGTAARMSHLVELALGSDLDPLDGYIEAHIHGPVELAGDVEALVLDPCYRDTEVEELAASLPCPIEWHEGLRLGVVELRRHPGYRGAEYVALGEKLARDGLLDARVIGDAARSGIYDEQSLKRVWHYVARFGEPWARRSDWPNRA